MKVENRAYASPIYMLFVSQGSRAQCFNERPGPHSNGLKPSAPPHCVASSRNKAVCAFLLVPRPRGCGCDGSLPSTKRIIAASRHFARRVASRESPSPRRLTRGFWRRPVAASAHYVMYQGPQYVTSANRRLFDARDNVRLMERANAMVTDAAGTMLALADPVAADAANALVNLNGAGHCSDTILAGAGLTVY